MKTLKELITMQSLTGEDDLQIIRQWFIQNNREQDGLTLIPLLAKSQTDKIQRKYDYALSWIPNLVDMRTQLKDKALAENLNTLQTLCSLSADLKNYQAIYDWAKANIPTMEIPHIFFLPTIKWLQKYGIEFIMTEAQRKQIDNLSILGVD